MKTIVLASKNPVKKAATRAGFQRMFPQERFRLRLVSVPSGVGDQPTSDADTLRGALNRAHRAAQQVPQADYWVGIEGGIETHEDEMMAFAWVVVQSKALLGKGRTGAFALPERVAQLIRQGKELGEADDIVFGRENSKQAEGAIGLLSGKVIDRAQLYEQAVILALVPFKNPALYKEGRRKE